MLTKNSLSIYQKLRNKKYRQKYGLFLIEGYKTIQDFMDEKWQMDCILYTDENMFQKLVLPHNIASYLIDEATFKKVSCLTTPSNILAIGQIPHITENKVFPLLALDGIQDPGNFGTIIRTADWYGLKEIYCSENTVDCFNPKVVQASMGSLARVNIHYVDLVEILKNTTVYATLLNGENIRNITPLSGAYVILLGNEGNGISEGLLQKVSHISITIPKIGGAESLNVAIATAICLERFLGK